MVSSPKKVGISTKEIENEHQIISIEGVPTRIIKEEDFFSSVDLIKGQA